MKAERTGQGGYRLRGLPLWVAGLWRVQLGLLVDDFTRIRLGSETTLAL